jgi:hypothetical protein
VPARNEAGNIEEVVSRIPKLGLGTEIIFVEGGSKDETWEELQGLQDELSLSLRDLFRQHRQWVTRA